MRYLVVGNNNGLGLELVSQLSDCEVKEFAFYSDNKLDLYHKSKLEEYVMAYEPDVIIDLEEDNDIDRAELSSFTEEDCFRKNVKYTKNLVDASKLVGAKFIYLSTDAVYSGKKDGYNSENDRLEPESVYGACKIGGEQAARENPKHFIIRPGMIYGGEKDYIDSILDSGSHEIYASDEEIVSPINVKDLAARIIELSLSDKYGTYNVSDKGAVTKKQFAEIIRNVYRRNYQVEDAELAYYVSKNRALNTDKLVENGFKEPNQWLINLGNYRRSSSKEKSNILKKEQK